MHRHPARPSYSGRDPHHVKEPVPFIIYYPGIELDSVEKYDEVSCVSGCYGLLQLQEFMNTFMAIN